MVNIIFYEDKQEIEQIPENFYDFIQIIGVFLNLESVDNLILEYTNDNKEYKLLNNETYNEFFLSGKKDGNVYVYSSIEETNYYKNKKEEEDKKEEKEDEKKEDLKIEEKEEEEEINTQNANNVNKDDGLKIPEITKDMVIASIVKQVKENMQKSRILQQKKQKEEEEKRKRKEKEEQERKEKEKQEIKGVSEQINNLITNRLDNLKDELINESQIKFSQIMSESQLNLNNMFGNNDNSDEENPEVIHSLEEHPGISCSKCGMSPIVGNRYCCVYCNDLNFCEKCEEKDGLNHGHPLYKFKLRII